MYGENERQFDDVIPRRGCTGVHGKPQPGHA